MLTEGRVALFCSRDLNVDAYGNRTAYGGGFSWHRTDTQITLGAFWVSREVPVSFRLHLFGDTDMETIGCLVFEVDACESLRGFRRDILHRIPLVFSAGTVREYSLNVEYVEDEVINIVK